ncbi:MAG: (S)-2-hydroxyglutarate dehydrogenase [Acidobacteriota bacterium]|jgi:L-2-hydroxyglutarate oxidase|nr:(S)-2-hydroxyglutarate dehydrogenase [Acidobacteriota bacterium]
MTSLDGSCDVAVVGGGLVGLAAAMALAGRGLTVTVLEAEDRVAVHQSGHNSGVVHSGLYYKPGSLKARLCVAGARALDRFCAEEGIAYQRCGKLVVALHPEELPRLEELERRGTANGLQGVRRLPAGEIRDVEPHAAGIAALHVPETAITDYPAVARAYAHRVKDRGGRVVTSARVTGVRRDGPGLVVETERGAFAASFLVNCAGLQSDRVARLCGAEPGVRIFPFRGEYYELAPERCGLVRGLIYPVPDPRFPFLGVHLTRKLDGGIEAGPNAVLALKREGYRWRDVSLRDAAGTASWPGFWRLAARYWRTGAYEVRRSLLKGAFVRDLQRLVPEIRPADLHRAGSGVRAQALDAKGGLVDDFRIVRSERAVHVLNAPSPAATASIPIGEEIAAMAAEALGS